MKLMRIILAVVIAIVAAAWLWLRGPDIPYATLEAKYGGAISRYVDLPGGYHVHYTDDGDPNLPLLVLLHGFADSFTTWEGWVGELKPRYHVISVDFPGHGLTRAPEGSRLSWRGFGGLCRCLCRRTVAAEVRRGGQFHGRRRGLATGGAPSRPAQCADPGRRGGISQREAPAEDSAGVQDPAISASAASY